MSATRTTGDLEDFSELLKIIRPQALQKIASDLREGQPCSVDSNPRSGSFNLIYPITFSDGLKWAARIPQHGTPKHFGELQARTLRIELQAQKIIYEETTIPVPNVIFYDTTFDNELGAPFSIVTWLEGTRICEAWDAYGGPGTREQRRLRMLESIADAMAQLLKWSTTQIGVPALHPEDEDDSIINIGVLCARDTSKEWEMMSDGVDASAICFHEHGPFTTASDYLNSVLNKIQVEAPSTIAHGQRKMLQIMVDAIELCESRSKISNKFVLTHPDFDAQNILVKEDGTLSGILDWDGVRTAPMQLGYAKYPSWIIRDWTPNAYCFWSQTKKHRLEEDTPAQLARYRRLYYKFIQQHLRGKVDGSADAVNSHIFQIIELACDSVHAFHSAVTKISRVCLQGSEFQMDHDILYTSEATASVSTILDEDSQDSNSDASSVTSTGSDELSYSDSEATKQGATLSNDATPLLEAQEHTDQLSSSLLDSFPTTIVEENVKETSLSSSSVDVKKVNTISSQSSENHDTGKPFNVDHPDDLDPSERITYKGDYIGLSRLSDKEHASHVSAHEGCSDYRSQGRSDEHSHLTIMLLSLLLWFWALLGIVFLSAFQIAFGAYETVQYTGSLFSVYALLVSSLQRCRNMLLVPFPSTKAVKQYQNLIENFFSGVDSLTLSELNLATSMDFSDKDSGTENPDGFDGELSERFGVVYNYFSGARFKIKAGLNRGWKMINVLASALGGVRCIWLNGLMYKSKMVSAQVDLSAHSSEAAGDDGIAPERVDPKDTEVLKPDAYEIENDGRNAEDDHFSSSASDEVNNDDDFCDAVIEQDKEAKCEGSDGVDDDAVSFKLSPNHTMPFWLFKVFDALGEGTLSDQHLENLREAFAAKFSSTEVIEDLGTIGD